MTKICFDCQEPASYFDECQNCFELFCEDCEMYECYICKGAVCGDDSYYIGNEEGYACTNCYYRTGLNKESEDASY